MSEDERKKVIKCVIEQVVVITRLHSILLFAVLRFLDLLFGFLSVAFGDSLLLGQVPSGGILPRTRNGHPKRCEGGSQKVGHLQQAHDLHKQRDQGGRERGLVQAQAHGFREDVVAQESANRARLVMDKEMVERCAKYTILKRPRHSVLNVPLQTFQDEPTHVSQKLGASACVSDWQDETR